MKVKKTELYIEPKFKPVKLEITFESNDEMTEFYTIFNWCPITDSLRHVDHDLIRQVLSVTGYDKVFYGFEESVRQKVKGLI